MNMETVKSSNIAAIGHEGETLAVQFNSGALYEYSGVPESVFKALKAAASIGAFFNQNIKSAYPFQKVG